jgi:5-methylthioadenosine/S-adenosylhomocysteine deaminase
MGEQQVPRTLIKDGYVVTVDAQRNVFPGGYVAIEGQRISEVGPASRVPSAEGFEDVVNAAGCIVMPGLINMHQHHWYNLFKGTADGYLLEDWVEAFVLPIARELDADAMRVSSYVAAMEMLSTGTTCSLNHSVTTTTPDLVKASIDPQREVGIRQVYAKEFRCRTPGNPRHPLDLGESAAAFEEEFHRWQKDTTGLVHFAIAIESNAHWVAAGMSTEELIARGHELATKLNLRITAHIAGGTFSVEKGFLRYLRETGRTDIRYLMQMGVLDSRWIIDHGIHCTDLDLEHMARVGCSLVYTPTSESIRGGGIGPAARAYRIGINVALGTDGPMVDYSVDMVEQMKCCTLLQHVRHLDPTLMPPELTIEMATINAAKALGLDDRIGSIEPGKQADISVFDIKKPYVGVLHRPISSFICAGKGSDVRVVLVDGRIVYRDGNFTRYADADRAMAEAERIGHAILTKAGLGHRLKPDWRN